MLKQTRPLSDSSDDSSDDMPIVESSLSRKGRRTVGLFGLAFGSIFLCVGIANMIGPIKRGFKQRGTTEWTMVEGEIISVTPKAPRENRPDSPMLYQYKVDERSYRSTRAALTDGAKLEYNEWLQLINGLPDSGKIPVYYNPADPNESMLITGEVKASWQGLKAAVRFAGFALVWMAMLWGISNWLPDRLAKKNAESGDEAA